LEEVKNIHLLMKDAGIAMNMVKKVIHKMNAPTPIYTVHEIFITTLPLQVSPTPYVSKELDLQL
jgi:hypothetical protein